MFRYRLQAYLKYYVRSVGAHALHSPFLFDLYKYVLHPSQKVRLSGVEDLRTQLRKNHQLIDLYDLKTQAAYKRTISSVARTSLSTPRFSAFLHLLCNFLQTQRVLETGTSLGINTLYLAGAECVQKVATMEASPVIAALARAHFNQFFQKKIKLKEGKVQDVFEQELISLDPDLIFLDADHRSETILHSIDLIVKNARHVKAIVIHDIYWSKDMEAAWKQLCQEARFALTIDLFQAGIIFPSQDMEKQHFTLRF